MLTALAFAHFSSELLLKEQMIIPVKKKRSPTLVISTQNWSILAKFAKKNPAKSAVFYWLFLGEVFPKNFPWNRPIFLRICAENPSKFDFFPLKSCKIGRFFCEFWLFSCEIGRFLSVFWLFSRENPMKLADFSANLPLKIPRNFAFFSTKYQKPCPNVSRLQSSCKDQWPQPSGALLLLLGNYKILYFS